MRGDRRRLDPDEQKLHRLAGRSSARREGPPLLGEDGHHELRTSHERPAHFTVRGRIPDDAKVGEAFIVDVGAHHPEAEGRPASTIRWLEVLYVTDVVQRGPKEGYGD